MVPLWKNAPLDIAGMVCVVGFALGGPYFVLAGDNKGKEPAGGVDQVGIALKNTATKVKQELSGMVKKLEESETPKRVGNELKRSAESLGQKVEGAGRSYKSRSSLSSGHVVEKAIFASLPLPKSEEHSYRSCSR